MKIAFVGQKGIPNVMGGIEKHVEELAPRLAEKGHKVIVYTRPKYVDSDLREYQGVQLISRPCIATKHIDAISHTFVVVLDLIFRQRVDLVHFHAIGPSSLLLLLRLFKPKIPIIVTVHSRDYLHDKWGRFGRAYLKAGEWVTCKFATDVISVSEVLRDFLRKEHDRLSVYIPNGVPLFDRLPANIIRKWDLEENNYILMVGRLIRTKCIHDLIAAYNMLTTNKKLVIVGGGSYSEGYIDELHELAANNPRIVMTGEQTGSVVQELYANAYLFVLPSEREGLSIALLEAMSYSIAVLVSDIPENLEAVGDAGFSFKQGDPECLARKLKYLLQDRELVEKHADAGVQRVRDCYQWKDVVGATINVYEKALSKE